MHVQAYCGCRHQHVAPCCSTTRLPLVSHRVQQQMSTGVIGWPHSVRRSALACVPDAAKRAVLMGNALIWLLIGGPAHADEATAASFNKNCIGCHIGGGNVVQAGKTLFTGDLERNGAGTPEAIYDLVYGGKGKMPGYGTSCQPRGKCTFGPRLSDDEIRRLSAFVLDSAAKAWK